MQNNLTFVNYSGRWIFLRHATRNYLWAPRYGSIIDDRVFNIFQINNFQISVYPTRQNNYNNPINIRGIA